jgi:hypothetical protein
MRRGRGRDILLGGEVLGLQLAIVASTQKALTPALSRSTGRGSKRDLTTLKRYTRFML